MIVQWEGTCLAFSQSWFDSWYPVGTDQFSFVGTGWFSFCPVQVLGVGGGFVFPIKAT